jgi:LuxR family transcriptional regulator, maltose regulon positive regulatory protein
MTVCDDLAVRPVEGSDFAVGRAGRPDAGGVVSRPGLVELLQMSGRVTVMSASAGSGKTVLLRSWISEAAPGLDGWTVVERLLKDLASLDDRVWLVIDDVHELGSGELLRQLELLVLRAPPELRFVLATRHDVRLGLHRLRLEGELTEIRTADLRFSLAEARELFAAEFSGSERTVAEYLLAEVLERQSHEVRRLLLRTSVLERVGGPLADTLTGGTGGERVLQELEAANAFVVSVDAARAWVRYHHLFAGLLQLELRTVPTERRARLRALASTH